MGRERDYKRFPRLADWLTAEEKRTKFINWIDQTLGLEGSWLRDTQIGVEFRLELYLEYLRKVGWVDRRLIKEEARLREYINQWQ